jgi:NADPH:quinone reductase-like Zn-dependent oxidoreductase
MKQWTTEQNGLEKLQFGEAERPTIKDGEVLVQIKAVSLNYRDTEGKTRWGTHPMICQAAWDGGIG